MKLLLIAGMGESVGLARDLSAIAGFEVICVTEGRAVARAKPPAKIYEGQFETDTEFSKYVVDQGFDMVIDAAHPFEFRLGTLARNTGLPYVRVIRAPWHPLVHENWLNVARMGDAAAAVPRGARVFLGTGRGSVFAFENRSDVYVMCRQLADEGQAFPLPHGRYIFGAGPFSVEDEKQLFQLTGADHLILRNSGSVQGRTKVDAACALGLQVIMIEQQDMGLVPEQMAEIDDVVDWVLKHANY